ncbi:enoyl-CoA hydratase/isomerase family protein [Asticcacaulis tiandongensis]|uniref:enoyl-CoA hydratase/isomerase family protein n=1 Tax=Asticcacaulis tiandongensis TaxID=2565365 RepID=UPI001FE38851|nr:enoyl-CoA hydratase/isomerase family protein [Asticcacaulis tiandongensis]
MTGLMAADKPLMAAVTGRAGLIRLNRPEALHALTTNMCQVFSDALSRWEADDGVALVMIDHAPETRGFCAGGDIRAVAESARLARSGLGDAAAARRFFRTEYSLNTRLKYYSKPLIAFMDGVVMGGGVGISVHGAYRIATENTLFAMPETGIGLFPDIGGGWFLPRLKGELGMWLALTGERLKGADVKAAGIATHYVASKDLPALKAALSESSSETIEDILARYDRPVSAPSYAEHIEAINRIFGKPTLTDIALALKLEDSDWAQHQGEVLATRSPLSLAVTHRQLRVGRQMQRFEEVMRMEYRIACRMCLSNDFVEGVRAVLEEKDMSPRWSPVSIGCVPEATVAMMFAPLDVELYD